MMNLFSAFNPITSTNTSLNWLIIMLPILTMYTPYWKMSSPPLIMNKYLTKIITNQFKSMTTKNKMSNIVIIISITMMIFTYNTMSLIPHTFSITSHITANLSLAMSMWTALMLNKLMNIKILMAHLTPSNTPPILTPLMVMIELVSLLIQPITLSIRLTANITAGHIMMTLISQMYCLTPSTALTMNTMMMVLELGVSFIQAYVFSMLIIMYMK